ncbi:Electron-transferring-flavoprotein dehydrogenase [Pyrobaculum neutrophilum V24Sta]|uniref:Electron-transferring-flavoprotein dehydrogenase n=1 Tax=Pyrobaculum neutrophilum (strain DSM 2338 / JCM 9278 / NBRC 100436 / V24Sta) TaxID=444157 RepID=B1YC60_PYRNV|nr:Electron-transferring-flavoprotein dehydrogenase [Pyrobaculum neutrophilum V24Sta]
MLGGVKFDVVVVGAGPAGLAAAYRLALAGFKVVVLERGREPGAKSLYGGRIYTYWLDRYLPEFRRDAPVDRWVKKERVTFLVEDKALTLESTVVEKTSFVTPLTSFVSWMARLAQNAGAKIVTEITVDRLVRDDRGRFIGVQSGSDVLYADYVIDAEGVNRLLLERAGVVEKLKPSQVALGVKEVWKFGDRKILEERLGLAEDEGVAWAVAGLPSNYLPGGGFIYTYKDAIALGVVIYLDSWEKLDTPVYDLVERFRLHPYISPLVRGATLFEYGGHMTPVAGINMAPPRLYYDGLLVAGDAAGFLLHTGVLIRGVDFAVASGILAAEAVREARSPSSEDLSIYEKKLRNSFVLPELERFKEADKLLSGQFLFRDLPLFATEAVHGYFNVGERQKTSFEAAWDASKKTRVNMARLFVNMLKVVRNL